MCLLFNLAQQPLAFQVDKHAFPRLLARQAAIRLRHFVVETRLSVEDRTQRQAVRLADLEIKKVVRRRDLQRARPLLAFYALVFDDRNLTFRQRHEAAFAAKRTIPLVFGMDGNGEVSEQRLRTHGGNCDACSFFHPPLLDQRVVDQTQLPAFFLLAHLQVGDRRLQLRIPIHKPFVAVDQALLVEFEKRSPHGARKPLVHRKARLFPVARRTQTTQLLQDDVAVLLFPPPSVSQEVLARKTLDRNPLLCQLSRNQQLGRDARMVCAGQPQTIVTLLTAQAHQDVLQGVVERVSDVQASRHVRRRHHEGVGLLAVDTTCTTERAALLPVVVERAFRLCGEIVAFVHQDALAS